MRFLDLLNEPEFKKLRKQFEKQKEWNELNCFEKDFLLEILVKSVKEEMRTDKK